MTNTKSTKRALLTSVMALFLCFTMLLGTTYAWFTDSVTSGSNIIQSGTLVVDLVDEQGNSMEGQIIEFVAKDGRAQRAILWEPGCTYETEPVYVVNKGNLDLKYNILVNGIVGDAKLLEVIEWTVTIDGVEIDMYTYENKLLAGEKSGAIVLTGHMKETAGNEYMNLTASGISISVFATQLTSENDSFGPNYDEDAVYYDALATTTEELKTALEAGKKVIGIKGTAVELEAERAGQNRDMNGVTIVGVSDDATLTITGTGGGLDNINLKNIKVVDSTFYTSENGENAWEFTYLELGGINTFVNVAFDDGIMSEGPMSTFVDCTFSGHNNDSSVHGTTTMYGAWVCNGKATFTGCYFSGTRSVKIHEAYGSNVESVVIDNCVIGALSEKPGVVIGDLDATTKVTIKNSTFANCQAGDQGMYIYESDTDVLTFDFICENNIVAGYVNKNEELKETLQSNSTVVLSKGEYKLPDVKGKEITLIGVGPETVVDYSQMGGYQEVSGSSFVFENMTVVNAPKGYPYPGLQHITSVKYVDCYIKGTVNLFAPATFTNCTLDSNGAEHNVVTYASDSVEFTNCKFVYGDRAVNCYAENAATRDVNVTFKNCDFTKVAGKESVGAIETNSSFMNSLHLTIDNCTVNEGKLWFVANPWDSLKGAKTFVTVDGKTEVATAEQLRALAATATGDVEVVLSSNITLGNDTDVCYAVNFANATSVTIDGNGNSIIFKGKAANKSDTSLDMVAGILSAGEITVKNVTLVNNKLGYFGTELSGDRIQVYTVVRGTSVSYEDVTFDGGVQVKNNTKFVRCTFNEDCLETNEAGYATNGKFCVFVDYEWSTDADCTVDFEGCTFNASGYGCVKLAGDKGAKLTANVKDCTFNNTCPSNSWSQTTPKYDVKMTGANITVNDLGGNTWAKGYGNG